MKSKPRKRKSTAAEIEDRVERIAVLVAQGAKRHEINEACRTEWGLSSRQAEAYTARARKLIAKASGVSREEMRGRMIALYEQALAECEEWPVRLKAVEGLRTMLGLDAPRETKSEVTVSEPVSINTAPLTQQRIDEVLMWRAERLLAAKQKAAATPPPPPKPVESAPVPAVVAAAAEQVPEVPEWKPLIPVPGRAIEEHSLPPAEKKKSGNGRFGIGGLF